MSYKVFGNKWVNSRTFGTAVRKNRGKPKKKWHTGSDISDMAVNYFQKEDSNTQIDVKKGE